MNIEKNRCIPLLTVGLLAFSLSFKLFMSFHSLTHVPLLSLQLPSDLWISSFSLSARVAARCTKPLCNTEILGYSSC